MSTASRPTRPPRPTRGLAVTPAPFTRSRGAADSPVAQTRRRPAQTPSRPDAESQSLDSDSPTGNPRARAATSRPEAERRGAAARRRGGGPSRARRRPRRPPYRTRRRPPQKAREKSAAGPVAGRGQPEQVAARSRAEGGWQHPPEVLQQDNGGYDGAVLLCKFRKLDRASILHF